MKLGGSWEGGLCLRGVKEMSVLTMIQIHRMS